MFSYGLWSSFHCVDEGFCVINLMAVFRWRAVGRGTHQQTKANQPTSKQPGSCEGGLTGAKLVPQDDLLPGFNGSACAHENETFVLLAVNINRRALSHQSLQMYSVALGRQRASL